MTHVLIVDDVEENRYLLQAVLESNGYRVTTANNGLEALAAARKEPPDLVVSDALMPEMDGFALCRAWMQESRLRVVPFIFYSATYTTPEDERFALSLGAVRYLSKPLEADEFLDELTKVLREWTEHQAPGPRIPMDEATFRAVYESTLVRKLDTKVKQLEVANQKLREREQNYRALFDANPHPMWVYDVTTLRFLGVNDTAIAHYGYTREEFLAMLVTDIRPAEDVPRFVKQLGARFDGLGSRVWRHRKKDGTLIDVEIDAHDLEFGGRRARTVSAHDISSRLHVERELAESEQRFRGLVEQSIAGIYVVQDDQVSYVNPRAAEIFGYGCTADLIGTEVQTLIAEQDRSLVAEHMRQLIEEQHKSVDFNCSGVRQDGSRIELEMHGAPASYLGLPAVIGLVTDITERKVTEERIQSYIEQLQSAFMSTVQVARTMGEMRDPYTAGHQRRVGEIAVTIGGELGWDEDQVAGLRVAGYLHDIGKITIPAEILARPGRLSDLEFQLIKHHPQASYDVLATVTFPWPIAEIALQHHERMDGSGYPRGLAGNAILMEARILAAADVVEAMSSHRPYRPALGVEAALAELERGSGTLFDRVVVDACLTLFRERGYEIPA